MYGDALRILGRTSEGIIALKNSLKNAPKKNLPDLYTRLGLAYRDCGKFLEAEEWFAAAAESDLDEERGWLWIFRGANFARQEKFDEAIECHLYALNLDCDRDEAYLNLGYVLRAQGKYEEAVDAFHKALSLTPDYPEAKEGLHSLEGISEILEKIALKKEEK
jgi:tetratricopeptide (TPR) repeat protein